MAASEPASFDLIVATVARVHELERLLASLDRQSHRAFRVLLVDQNEDDRLEDLLREHPSLEIVHLRSSRGLSRARNAALPHVRADLVAFPDDDCTYAPDLLEQVAGRFAAQRSLDGLTGRAVDPNGRSSRSWKHDPVVLTRDNLWNRAISYTIFLRARLVRELGVFDERLGLGARTSWSSGEEIDLLVRALDAGARIEYTPHLVVTHWDRSLAPPELEAIGGRDGASVGYLLRKHGYPAHTVGRMFARPIGGALLSLAQRDRARARFHISTLRGRLRGYRS